MRFLRAVGDFCGVDECWYYRGAFHFRLKSEWTVAVKPESADRMRLDTCHLTVPADRTWCRVNDLDRLTYLLRSSQQAVGA